MCTKLYRKKDVYSKILHEIRPIYYEKDFLKFQIFLKKCKGRMWHEGNMMYVAAR